MTKKDIVKSIAADMNLSQGVVHEVIRRALAAVVDALVREKRVELRNFGVFEVRVRAPRKARNPRTNQRLEVPPRAVAAFKAGKDMSHRIAALPLDEVREALMRHLAVPPKGLKPMPGPPEDHRRPSEGERPVH